MKKLSKNITAILLASSIFNGAALAQNLATCADFKSYIDTRETDVTAYEKMDSPTVSCANYTKQYNDILQKSGRKQADDFWSALAGKDCSATTIAIGEKRRADLLAVAKLQIAGLKQIYNTSICKGVASDKRPQAANNAPAQPNHTPTQNTQPNNIFGTPVR